MNLFVSHPCPAQSAIALADRHVVKMPLEAAQINWSAFHLAVPDRVPAGGYKPTHLRHPVVVWASLSQANAMWVNDHGVALCLEYAHRYGRTHGSLTALLLARDWICLLPNVSPSPFVLAMDDDLKSDDTYESYRGCLRRKYAAWGDKARWTKREKPSWL